MNTTLPINIGNKIRQQIVELIIEQTKNKLPNFLQLSALGARVCYSSQKFDELVTDKRLNELDVMIEYLSRLIQMQHFSVFEHSVLKVNLNKIVETVMSEFYLRDLIDAIGDDVGYLFDAIGVDIYQKYPVLVKEKELQGFKQLIKAILKLTFPVIYVTSNNALINIRHILEFKLLTFDNNSEMLVDWFKNEYCSRIQNIPMFTENYNISKIELETGANVYVITKHYEENTVIGATYLLEGVSRVLTHQLVRHRLFSSYSQRSHRHTKVNEDEFVIPTLNYVTRKQARQKLQKEFSKVYKHCIDEYNKLTEDGVTINDKQFKVRKEDARFIIPDGVKTTILVTMLGEGLYNFINERTNEHAQWEIREVATKLKILLGI